MVRGKSYFFCILSRVRHWSKTVGRDAFFTPLRNVNESVSLLYRKCGGESGVESAIESVNRKDPWRLASFKEKPKKKFFRLALYANTQAAFSVTTTYLQTGRHCQW